MKRKKLILILIAEAILLGAVTLMTNLYPKLLSSVLAFPLEPVYKGLRFVAKAGPVANGFAVMIAAALVLLPVFFALRMKGEGKKPEIISLLALAGVILLAFYGAWNPGVFQGRFVTITTGFESALLMILSLAVWSMVILFIVLRLIRLFRAGNREQLIKYLRFLLCALCVYFTAELAVTLTSGICKLAGGLPTTGDMVLCAVSTVVSTGILLLDIAVAFRMLDLLDTASTEEQEGLAKAASRLSRISCAALACTAVATALVQVLQVCLLPSLTDVTALAQIPLLNIFFVLVILLLSRLLIENKQLKDDNSLFI